MSEHETKPVVANTASGSFSAPESYVLVVSGDGVWREPLPAAGTMTIGRADDAEIRVRSSAVSRRHARLEVTADTLWVEDLGSHNGTRVNGAAVAGMRSLATGDTIEVGDVQLIVRLARSERVRCELLEPARMLVRIGAEVERARDYGHPLSLMCVDVGETDDQSLAALLSPVLRAFDVAGRSADGHLLVLCLELSAELAVAFAGRVTKALLRAFPEVGAGVASFPAAAADAESLYVAARASLARRSHERVQPAGDDDRVAFGDDSAVVADPAMVRIYALLRKLAAGDMPVLLCGETGAGKDLAARAVHAWSRRKDGPFVAVNCAALPRNLIESELFGYKRGAFSGADSDKPGFFAAAHGGTIFLDELGELELELQSKLLRALDRGEIVPLGSTTPIKVDVRIVSATNRDLISEIEARRFRQDLYYRLGAATLVIPPLRDRPREIPLLARALLAATCARLGRPALRLSDASLRQLAAYSFPGNVRELANAMDYAASVADDDVVEPWHLPAMLHHAPAVPARVDEAEQPPSEPRRFRPITEEIIELEKRRMQEALEATGGNQSKAAKLIDMPRRSFTTKLSRYGLRASSADDD